jgi:LCP family protein required for cell wall assembly
MSADTFSNSYSRRPAGLTVPRPAPAARATRGQRILEYVLFVVFGSTIALATFALYATNTPEHNAVPNLVDAGLRSNRVNLLLMATTTRNTASGSAINTQSLMMLSVQPSTGRAVLISIPADLWVKVGHYGTRPLRSAHTVGDASGYPGAGAGLTIDTVEKVLGQPIHAYGRIDHGDLRRTIDQLGGVDVVAKRGVFEYRNKLRFQPGAHHLDGLRALRYAHSPYVTGPAAERFAREERQQQVVRAAIEKIVRRNDVEALETLFSDKSSTNLTSDQIATLHAALRRGGEMRTVSFAPYMNVVEVTGVAYRGKAVTPRSGNFSTVQSIASTLMN